MATRTSKPSTEQSDEFAHNARGEWRPADPIKFAPLLQWPIRLKAIVKWIFGWPGYLWPQNIGFLSITAVMWFLTQPAISRCVNFEAGWMLQVLGRNMVLMWLFYGGLYYYLYIRKAEGTKTKFDAKWPTRNSRVFLFRDQVYDNIFWTCGVAGLIWTGFEILTLWLYANGYIPWLSWADHPIYFVGWFLVTPLWRDFHFYWIHRLTHWKPLYKYVHYLHHKNINPNPWSGMAMHPVEALLYLSVVTIHWIIPSHPIHALYTMQHAVLGAAHGHHGFEGPLVKGKIPSSSYFHYLHHRYFECNYGGAVLPLDKWFGTFRDGRPDGEGSKLAEEQKV